MTLKTKNKNDQKDTISVKEWFKLNQEIHNGFISKTKIHVYALRVHTRELTYIIKDGDTVRWIWSFHTYYRYEEKQIF